MEDKEQENCDLLTSPLALHELIGSGAIFEINRNYDNGITDEIYDEIYGSDGEDDDIDVDKKKPEEIVSPWLRSFKELKEKMLQVNENIYKRVIVAGNMEKPLLSTTTGKAKIRYHSYWEGDRQPFDSSSLHGEVFTFEIGQGNVLEGLEKAVSTMFEGEKAEFIISYKLLFGEMGCPPRIKKRADALYVIELISYEVLDEQAQANSLLPPEERNKFCNVFMKAKELHSKGLDFFNKNMYRNALQSFSRASDALEFCRLANEEEETQQTKLLLKLYMNKAVIYNKMNLPKKTCIVCRHIWNLCDNRPPCKALFHKGRAYFMLGEYQKAKDLLLRALRMEPNNSVIEKEIEVIEEHQRKFKESIESVRRNVLGLENNENSASNNLRDTEFEKNMQEILEDFKTKSGDEKLALPAHLTEAEILSVENLAEQLDMKLTCAENSYFIKKT